MHYWARDRRALRLDLTVVNDDGRSDVPLHDASTGTARSAWTRRRRTRCSGLIGLKDRFDIAFACDTDHDRHGIVTRSAGLLPPNHYLAVAIDYLFRHRPRWRADAGSARQWSAASMIDRVAAKLGRKLYEVPVGFKWFVDGLLDGSLGFGGEESAGASFLRTRRHRVDHRQGRHRRRPCWRRRSPRAPAAIPASSIASSRGEFGEPVYERIDAPATPAQKKLLSKLSPEQVTSAELAGETIQSDADRAPGNDAPIGGIKVIARARLVRRAAVGHRRRVQDLRREFPRRRASAADPGRGTGHRYRRDIGCMDMDMYRWAVHVAGFRAWRDGALYGCDAVPADPGVA